MNVERVLIDAPSVNLNRNLTLQESFPTSLMQRAGARVPAARRRPARTARGTATRSAEVGIPFWIHSMGSYVELYEIESGRFVHFFCVFATAIVDKSSILAPQNLRDVHRHGMQFCQISHSRHHKPKNLR